MQRSKTWLLAAALAALGAGAFGAHDAQARTVVGVYATTEPPPPRHEVVPAPRRGYVWVPGYWTWSHRHYVWVGGHWVRERRGYHYEAARWDRDGGRWHYVPGRWVR
ncbi:MAG TPA: YXWGXW repeat-containing protein [Dokdonella sp.]